MYVIDLAETAITMYCAWQQLVWSQGPYESLPDFLWSVGVSQLLAGIVSFMTQCFFARRIWILKNTSIMRKLVICIVTLAVTQFASVVSLTALMVLNSSNTEALDAETAVTIMWLAGSFVCDTLIAGSLLHTLVKARSETPIKRTATILTKLITVTVQTGFITAFVAGLQLVAFFLSAYAVNNQYHIMFSFLLGKLYSNVLLATLNARTVAVRVVDNEVDTDLTTQLGQGIVFRAASSTRATGLTGALQVVSHAIDNEPIETSKEHADGRFRVYV
ncbi:hypothetical protein PLICRDRAFT_177765 [Plicaturopsis crispa FD-325 SS-3]|nr:hypothetical protein PLICRDRAFT_177765 [Plicaturopsis crispa FD-325 SS-3]